MSKRGLFITLESPDGAGKTTAIPFIKSELEGLGYVVRTSREPGGCEVSEKIRELVLGSPMNGLTEVLLFAAARNEHLRQTILPAIGRGQVVLCDRFADSTYAYQAAGRGYTDAVLIMESVVLAGFAPDYTLFFDASVETCARRLTARGGKQDRLDAESTLFKERVREGYMHRFHRFPNRMVRIDANGERNDVQGQLRRWITETLIPAHPPTPPDQSNG